MASDLAKNWVTFDQEEVEEKRSVHPPSDPWQISGRQSTELLSRSSSSDSSSFSSLSTSSFDSRGSSPTHNSEEGSKYLAFKALQNPAPTELDDDDISETSDSKYSVFSSLRECEEKGEYLGWSKKVLGEAMGWSETLKAKPSF